jgi:hypothetical protein
MPTGNALPDGVLLGGAPLVLNNGHSDLEIFVLGSDDQIWHVHETPGDRWGWSDWENRGGPIISPPSGGRNFDERLELFAQFRDNGAMRQAYQRVAGGLWSGWEHDYGMPMQGVPATATNADGRLEVIIHGPDGQLYHTWQDQPGSDLGSLELMPDSNGAGPVATGQYGGRVLLWASAADQTLMHTNQGRGWPKWTPWDPVRLLPGTAPVCILDALGRPALAITDEHGHVLTRQFDGTNWLPWTNLGGEAAGSPALSRNADGRLEVFVRGRNGMLQHRWQPW